MLKQTSTSMPGCRIVILLIFLSGAALLLLSPVSADPAGSMEATTVVSLTVTSPATAGAASAPPGSGVTISADGDTSYYLGEKVVFRGHNYDSDTTYLFFTGPATFMDGPGIPAAGGNLTSPRQPVVSGKPDSFTPVKTKADKTWEYTWYTSGVTLDAGTYSMYAVSRPDAKDQAGPDASWVKIIVKKPFLSAEISPAAVTKGEPFTVTGSAEGEPPSVQLWIIGNNVRVQYHNPGKSWCILYVQRRYATLGKTPGRPELSDRPALDAEQHVRYRCQRGLRPQPEPGQRYEYLPDLRPGKPAGQRCGRGAHCCAG